MHQAKGEFASNQTVHKASSDYVIMFEIYKVHIIITDKLANTLYTIFSSFLSVLLVQLIAKCGAIQTSGFLLVCNYKILRLSK